MVAFLAAERAILSVEKYALADMRLHVALGGRGGFTSTIAEGTIRIGNLYQTPARTDRAVLKVGLSHLL